MKKKLLFFLISLTVFSMISFISAADISAEEGFPFKARVNANNVKLRAGYNENFTALKNLKESEEVIVLDRYFCWYQVMLPSDVFCYVSKEYINDEGFVTANQLNVRAGASEKYHILGKLKKGEPVLIIESVGDWYKIRPPEGASGWINENYLDKAGAVQLSDIPKPSALKDESINSREIIDYGKLPKIKNYDLEDYTTDELKVIILTYTNFCNTYPESQYTEDLNYKLNLLNIQLKNRQEEIIPVVAASDASKDLIDVAGTLRDLGRVYGTTASHKLKIKGRTKYYLKSSNVNLDDYIYKDVTLQGIIVDKSSKYPLIDVRKVTVE
jgi:uncharacterized protein YgiM (DUF1202 family)